MRRNLFNGSTNRDSIVLRPSQRNRAALSGTPVESATSSPQISRKPTLEECVSTNPLKRSITSVDSDESCLRSAKLRRTQSAAIPCQTRPAPASNVFSGASLASASSSVQEVPKGIHLISHCDRAQHEMDQRKIAWGVQYEIARGVTCGSWSWGDVTAEKLNLLRGSNTEAAPKVSTILLGPHCRPSNNLQIW